MGTPCIEAKPLILRLGDTWHATCTLKGVTALQSISPIDWAVRAEAPAATIYSFVPAGGAESARSESRRAVRQLLQQLELTWRTRARTVPSCWPIFQNRHLGRGRRSFARICRLSILRKPPRPSEFPMQSLLSRQPIRPRSKMLAPMQRSCDT